MRTSPNLPPLLALRAFASVGRLLSFRKAAEELLISQSAISHHIRQLETMLGADLFVRHARSISLTPAGANYLEQINAAFETIIRSTAELRAGHTRGALRVSLLPSFCSCWLMARLDSFSSRHPDVELALDPTLKPVSFDRDEADLGIRYGLGDWNDVDTRLLYPELLVPVASPRLCDNNPSLLDATGFAEQCLLESLKSYEWELWSKVSGVDLARAKRLRLTDYNIVIQAAIEGRGVALGRSLLVRKPIDEGKLVCLRPPISVASTLGYWLVSAHRRPFRKDMTVFAEWLVEELDRDASAPLIKWIDRSTT